MPTVMPKIPTDAGRDQMRGQRALSDWLESDATGSGKSLLEFYRGELESRSLTQVARKHRGAVELDMLNADLSASVSLATGLIAASARAGIEQCDATIRELEPRDDDISKKRLGEMIQQKAGWAVRMQGLAGHIEPLTDSMYALTGALGVQLASINDVYVANRREKPPTALAESIPAITSQCGTLREKLNIFASMVRTDRKHNPSTDMCESAAQEFVLEALITHINDVTRALGARVSELPNYWPDVTAADIKPGFNAVREDENLGVNILANNPSGLLNWMQRNTSDIGNQTYRDYQRDLRVAHARGWRGDPHVQRIDLMHTDYNASALLAAKLLMMPTEVELKHIRDEQANLSNRYDQASVTRRDALREKMQELSEKAQPMRALFSQINTECLGLNRDMGKAMEKLCDAQHPSQTEPASEEFTDSVTHILPETVKRMTGQLKQLYELADAIPDADSYMGQHSVNAFCKNTLLPHVELVGRNLRGETPSLATYWPDHEARADAAVDAARANQGVEETDPQIGQRGMYGGQVSADVVNAAIASGQVTPLFPRGGRGGGAS